MTLPLTLQPSASAVQLGLPDIAFTGKSGAGKSTAAQLLVDLGLGYQVLSFSRTMKNIVHMLWGGGPTTTDRDKLQRLGTAVREIDPDTWVNSLLLQYHDRNHLSRYDGHLPRLKGPVVVDDCRFENEWYALKAEGFTIVRVIAPRIVRIDRLKANGKWQNEEQLEHISEKAVDHLQDDHAIYNTDTTQALYDRLVDIVIKERAHR